MKLDPLHPAASILERLRTAGFTVRQLLAFTRRSTVVLVGEDHSEVIKLFFGSDHILDALPPDRKSSAYGFYWYASKSAEERAYETEAVATEIAITEAMTGASGWPVVLGSGTLNGVGYMRLRRIEGSTFKFPRVALIDKTLPSIRILATDADALVQLHSAGYVHRDLYHENILTDGKSGTIIDLGNAKRVGQVVGPSGRGPEPHWPPEYLTGFSNAGTAADVYSLGVLLHRTISCDIPRPWTAALLTELVDTQMTQLVLSCLERQPGARPAAQEVAARLGQWLGALRGNN